MVCVLSNNPNALVLERATNLGVKIGVFNKEQLNDPKWAIENLKNLDLIVLAGFLWKFPDHILENYQNKVVNVHPALLPKYGGKGMYGMHVHKAVVENNESESGITIHYVNEHYDEGAVIFQAKCTISTKDTPNDVAAKIHQLEMKHFPRSCSTDTYRTWLKPKKNIIRFGKDIIQVFLKHGAIVKHKSPILKVRNTNPF